MNQQKTVSIASIIIIIIVTSVYTPLRSVN